MRHLKEFDIEYAGLREGHYDFDFVIGKSFFDFFGNEEAQNGKLGVKLALERQERMLILDFDIKGSIEVQCDRCLGYFDQAVENRQQILAKFGDESREEDDNLIIIPEKQHKINVAQFIYEFIILALPIKKVHPDQENGEPGCDPGMLKKLNDLQKQHTADGRWDELKKLKTGFDN